MKAIEGHDRPCADPNLLFDTVLLLEEQTMAKGAMRPGKEARKPKKDAKKPAAAPTIKATPVQAIRIKEK